MDKQNEAGQVEAVAEAANRFAEIIIKNTGGHALCNTAGDILVSSREPINITHLIKASDAGHIAGLVAKNEELRDALLDMVWQFCSRNDKLAHSFMSAEEHAFDVLDLDNGMTYEEAETASKAAINRILEVI